jgi:hypothetical protein
MMSVLDEATDAIYAFLASLDSGSMAPMQPNHVVIIDPT